MKTIYIILLAGLFLLLLSIERVQKEKTGYRAASLMEDISFKQARNQYLRYRLNIYKSPDKITAAAKELDMHVTPPGNVIILKVKNDPENKN